MGKISHQYPDALYRLFRHQYPNFLGRAGSRRNSCTEDRIAILRRAIERFGAEKIEALLADREFIGKEWFDFLIANKIPFVIRIKQNSF